MKKLILNTIIQPWTMPLILMLGTSLFIILSYPFEQIVLYIPLAFLVIFASWLAVKYYFGMRILTAYMKECFQDPSAAQLLRYYDKTIRSNTLVAETDFMRSYSKSLVLSFYGEFEESLSKISQFDMKDKENIYQAMQLNGIVTNKYLQKADIESAFADAQRALELSDVPEGTPGKEISQNAYEAYVEIGEILMGISNDPTISRLEERFDTAPFLLQLIIAWALGTYYHAQGDSTKSTEMKIFLNQNAPHCKPLFLS